MYFLKGDGEYTLCLLAKLLFPIFHVPVGYILISSIWRCLTGMIDRASVVNDVISISEIMSMFSNCFVASVLLVNG